MRETHSAKTPETHDQTHRSKHRDHTTKRERERERERSRDRADRRRSRSLRSWSAIKIAISPLFVRIWWFFSGFCLCFEEWMILCIRLVTDKMWENVSNKYKMCFLRYFQEHNQTSENIFRNIFWNATKYMKIFSFPENSISRKYLFSGNTFTRTKRSLTKN